MGSVGTRAWILLMFGRDESDPLFLQAKEAQPSVLEEFVGPSRHSSNGERVVHGQHLMAAAADIFLGWLSVDSIDGVPRDYYLRQLRDWKGSAVIESMVPGTMAYYGRLCGTTLARAHARSGDRVAIASYLGVKDVFDQALADFAESPPTRTSATTARLSAPRRTDASAHRGYDVRVGRVSQPGCSRR